MPQNFQIKIPPIDFTSHLAELIIKLEALRSQYTLAPHSQTFLQLREIFSMLESIQSARIEGNRTTIADYADTKFDGKIRGLDSIQEIQNIENAISYVDNCYSDSDFKISHSFIKELHSIVTSGLKREGSNESGSYRHKNVIISNAEHKPPEFMQVQNYMDKLVEWINNDADKIQTLSLKVAIAHHVFTWIHPFDNGNGRMSRVLTYAMLKQYGFDMVYLLNPSAVFCIDRDLYFEKLQTADKRTDEAYLEWCEYVLQGLNAEMKKIIKLMDRDFLNNKIILPSINKIYQKGLIPKEYKIILELSVQKDNNMIKSKDIQEILPDLSTRQINSLVTKMISQDYLERTVPKGRIYHIKLMQENILKNIFSQLEHENLFKIV